jgi:ABC-2 type transport system ATP-binding protein
VDQARWASGNSPGHRARKKRHKRNQDSASEAESWFRTDLFPLHLTKLGKDFAARLHATRQKWFCLAANLNVMDAIIKIDNLRVEFSGPTRKLAVADLTLRVHAGEVFGFLGPNGAGKTTTMNVLLGFVNPTGGEARIFGVNVREPIARQRIGYLPELTYYYKFLSAEELLRFYARIFEIPKSTAEARIDSVLKLVELDAARTRLIKTYSKGMQQRVGLAQALINDPDLLILDEPTSGLDPIGRMKVREIIQRLKNQGKTVFFSSHELGEVETVCDRVAILNQGELKMEGRVSELVEKYQCNLEQVFLKMIGYAPD